MKGFEIEIYRYYLLIANLIAIIILLASLKWPRAGRALFSLLFAWACWMNWQTLLRTPQVYLEYADYTWSGAYRNFINGWFSRHIEFAVGLIATCQGAIALSMLLYGKLFRAGAIGAVVFLLAITPFGMGSGFPATAIMALGLILILRKHSDNFIWRSQKAVAI